MVISVLFALMLFLTATANNYNSTRTQIGRTTETYSHTLENVPIDIKYDSDKYFISGYSYETEVYLTSTNRLKLDSEINSDTRKFKVVADLTHLNEGTSKVTLQVKDLPDDVAATVSPVSMSVTIGKKKTKKFPVKVVFDDEDFEDSYELIDYKIDQSEVEVTSDEATIDQIDYVVAKLPDSIRLSTDYDGEVTLQAVTSSGMILPAVVEPAKANLRVRVNQLNKTVPVRVEYIGNLDSSLSDIKYEASLQSVTIFGTQEALDAVSEIIAKVDISNVTKDVTQTVLLMDDRVIVSPTTMDVRLSVVKKK